jgi:uncharacterized protein
LKGTPILVWAIDPGLPGETNQCLGVAAALARVAQVRVEVVSLRLRSKWLAPLFRLALQTPIFTRGRMRWPVTALYRLFFSGPQLGREVPEVTVSTLGRGEIPALFLRQLYGSYALHIGIPRRAPSGVFDLVMHLPSQDTSKLRCPAVALDIVPTPVLLEDVRAYRSPLVEQWCKLGRRLCAVLVGGDGSGYAYRPDEWQRFAQGLQRLSKTRNLGLLLTTSRRTGATGEAALKASNVDLPGLTHAVWFGDESPAIMTDYLAASEIVLCTEDSRSMISDAIAAGKYVYTARPERVLSKDVRLFQMLKAQEARRRLRRITLDEIGDIDIDSDIASYFQPRAQCWSSELLRAIERSVPDLWKRMLATPSDNDPAHLPPQGPIPSKA